MLYSITYKICCGDCGDVSEGEGSTEDAKDTAKDCGWLLRSRSARCPSCQRARASNTNRWRLAGK